MFENLFWHDRRRTGAFDELLLIQLTCDVFEELLELGPELWHERVNLFLYGLANVAVFEVVEEVAYRFDMKQLLVRAVHDGNHLIELLDKIYKQICVFQVNFGQERSDQLANKQKVRFCSHQRQTPFPKKSSSQKNYV